MVFREEERAALEERIEAAREAADRLAKPTRPRDKVRALPPSILQLGVVELGPDWWRFCVCRWRLAGTIAGTIRAWARGISTWEVRAAAA